MGKTYILKEFGSRHYENVAYLNCDNNPDVEHLFDDYNIPRILRAISALTGQPIVEGKTLIILDEVQEAKRGLSALKYFCEEAPGYHIVVAGSLLGITLHPGVSFPVGKVDLLSMRPMSFREFLLAKDNQPLVELLESKDWEALTTIHSRLVELLREYYFVGGMPEAVQRYMATNDVWEVRKVQKEILTSYRDDISKHAPLQEAIRIGQVWRSIPSQLARENKKFIYSSIRQGARAKEFEVAIQWLIDSGLVYKVNRVNRPTLPLSFYEDINVFKLYMLDCGLLGALSDTPPSQMLIGNNVFQEYKGAFTENFVLCELQMLHEGKISYYTNANSTLEVDFLIQREDTILPIEVKAETNLKSKSLRQFISDNPTLKGLRFSMSPYRIQDWMTNVPLYAVRPFLQ